MEIDLVTLLVLITLVSIGSSLTVRLKRMEARNQWLEHRLEHGLAALGVDPEDSPAVRGVRHLVQENKTVEAVRLWRDATGVSLKDAKRYVDEVAVATGQEAVQ